MDLVIQHLQVIVRILNKICVEELVTVCSNAYGSSHNGSILFVC